MPLPPWPFLRVETDGSVIIDLHVMPNAAQTRLQGLHDGALHVRLKAPPVEGKANVALQAWLAQALGLSRNQVALCRGQTSRRKQFRVSAHAAARAQWQALTPPGLD